MYRSLVSESYKENKSISPTGYRHPEAVNLRAKVNGKGEFTFSRSSEGQSGESFFTVDSRSGLRALRRLIEDATGTGVLEL
jgi:hypothetical protein